MKANEATDCESNTAATNGAAGLMVLLPTMSERAFRVTYRDKSIEGRIEALNLPGTSWRKSARAMLLRGLSERRGFDLASLKREAVVAWV